MKIHTSRFGAIEIDETGIYTFPAGVPGFEYCKQYVLLQPSQDMPFCYLQSVENGDLAFLVTDPFLYYHNYEFQLSESQQIELKITQTEEIAIWSVVTVPASLQDATLNLKAPIILNVREKQGKQVILHETDYGTKHPLLPPVRSV
ncbi:flagellar assembly protein FliW [Paenibacillus alkalitolerans]|uniref:flagellar assembly protein FliW n=1 Tax=Paenibacillus alkalitolerans TaxID=2799335 RepID=UPI0018F2F6FB|nr:flagellar assembly protein FliW [Paenibacillus alkalitolerans]